MKITIQEILAFGDSVAAALKIYEGKIKILDRILAAQERFTRYVRAGLAANDVRVAELEGLKAEVDALVAGGGISEDAIDAQLARIDERGARIDDLAAQLKAQLG